MGSAPNAANSPAVLEAEAGDTMRLPEIVARRARELADGEAIGHLAPGHPKGRVVAVVLIWLGWIAVSGGLALVAIGLSGYSAALGESVAGLPLGAVAGAPLVLIGLCLVLAGYVSIATFDTSDAIREIKLLTRARADL